MLSQDEKIQTVATLIPFKRFVLTLKWNEVQGQKARFRYTVYAMLCTSKSLLQQETCTPTSTPQSMRKARETPQQHFCMGYLTRIALSCVQGAASTHLKGLSVPKATTRASNRSFTHHPAPGTSNWSWQCPRSQLGSGRKAQEQLCRLLGAPRHKLLQDCSAWGEQGADNPAQHGGSCSSLPSSVSHLRCTFGKTARHDKH